MATVVALIATSGCGGGTQREPLASNVTHVSSPHAPAAGLVKIDAGVIFAGQPSYHCIPLAQLGISSAADISSLNTSCECVQPSLVRYQLSRSDVQDALRLDFNSEIDAEGDQSSTSLGVKITIQTTGGAAQTFVVAVTESQPVFDTSSQARSAP